MVDHLFFKNFFNGSINIGFPSWVNCVYYYALEQKYINQLKEELAIEESLFIRELGIKSPMLKVLDFLMDNESFDYSRAEIEEGAGLSKTTLLKIWPKLEAL